MWYGRFSRNGQRFDKSLGVEIKGKIPLTPKGRWDHSAKGDAAFERSKAQAEKAFAEMVKADGDQRKELKKAETKILALTGQQVGKTSLASLWDRWCALERNRQPHQLRIEAARRTFEGFTKFATSYAANHGFCCSTLEEVTPEIAKAWFAELSREYAWGTIKEKYGTMRNAWKRWARSLDRSNPFGEVILRKSSEDTGRVSRVPLTMVEVTRLFDIVREKRPTLYPLLTCVACTGLRLVDACSLKWSEVHFSPESDRQRGVFGMIERVTTKTGARVIVPIIQPWADALLELDRRRDSRDEYVFPTEYARYKTESTRTGLVREIKPYMALAVDPDAMEKFSQRPTEVSEDGSTEVSLEAVLEAVSGAKFADSKRSRLERIARESFAGIAPTAIAEAMGIARGQVSVYLDELESLVGARLRKRAKAATEKPKTGKRALIEATRGARSSGKCQASLYGWHSLRATFVVLGVEAGVPLPYIEKAVGHETVEMTLQYFNPTAKHAAAIMGDRLGRSFAGDSALPALSDPVPMTAEGVLSSLSDAERKKLSRMLLEQMNII